MEVCRRALDTGELPTSGGERPHLTITVDLATLQPRPGAPEGTGGDPAGGDPGFPAAALHAGSGAAQLEHAGPISALTLRRLGCDAMVSRILMAGCQ